MRFKIIIFILAATCLFAQGRRRQNYTRVTTLSDSALFTFSDDSSGTRVERNVLVDTLAQIIEGYVDPDNAQSWGETSAEVKDSIRAGYRFQKYSDTDDDYIVDMINDGVINYGMMDGEILNITESDVTQDTVWKYVGLSGDYANPTVMSFRNNPGNWPLESIALTLSGAWWAICYISDWGPKGSTVSAKVFIIDQ